MYQGVGWDVESTVSYLNELGERTMRSELFAVAELIERTAKDRDYWKERASDELNRSLRHGQKMMGIVLKGLVEQAEPSTETGPELNN
ncbi:MAG: hypothetical protein BGO49_24695 [Planctomycetales bacterium 71-10]|nr:MAG: hypothetical protein BGO49_24695 [Planctomycetales bacterium 71-10]